MKTKVIDTNAILDHSLEGILEKLKCEEEIKIIIPFKVAKELDTFKKGTDIKNYNARKSIHFLESLRKNGDLDHGATYENFLIQVVLLDEDNQLDMNRVDDNVIEIARIEKEVYDNDVEVISEDVHERLLASAFNVKSTGLDLNELPKLYTGMEHIPITDKQVQEWNMCPDNPHIKTRRKLYANQFVVMHDSLGGIHYGVYNDEDKTIYGLKRTYEAWTMKPKKDNEGNVIVEQAMLMHALLDPSIKFVSVIGPSGCGKTFLALAAGLEQTLNTKIYNKIIVMRPLMELDKDIGALPGDKLDKLEPWLGSSFDNLECLLEHHVPKGSDLEMIPVRERIYELIEQDRLEFEAMAYIRGRSIQNKLIIVDDAQNLSPHQAATIITRAGEGSKIIFLGDISKQQIDNPKLNPFNNGLTYVAERFKGASPIVAHLTMTPQAVVRSDLASLGVELL